MASKLEELRAMAGYVRQGSYRDDEIADTLDFLVRGIEQLGRFLNASDVVEDATTSFELHQGQVKELNAARRAIDDDVRRLVGYVPGLDDRPIAMLGLDVKTTNAILRNDIRTIGALRDYFKEQGDSLGARAHFPHLQWIGPGTLEKLRKMVG